MEDLTAPLVDHWSHSIALLLTSLRVQQRLQIGTGAGSLRVELFIGVCPLAQNFRGKDMVYSAIHSPPGLVSWWGGALFWFCGYCYSFGSSVGI